MVTRLVNYFRLLLAIINIKGKSFFFIRIYKYCFQTKNMLLVLYLSIIFYTPG